MIDVDSEQKSFIFGPGMQKKPVIPAGRSHHTPLRSGPLGKNKWMLIIKGQGSSLVLVRLDDGGIRYSIERRDQNQHAKQTA